MFCACTLFFFCFFDFSSVLVFSPSPNNYEAVTIIKYATVSFLFATESSSDNIYKETKQGSENKTKHAGEKRTDGDELAWKSAGVCATAHVALLRAIEHVYVWLDGLEFTWKRCTI